MKKKAGRPASTYSQGERLLELYDRLHRHQTLRVSELASSMRVSRRTLQRDFKELRRVLGEECKQDDSNDPSIRLVKRDRFRRITKWQVMGVSLGLQMTRFLSGRSFRTEVEPVIDALREALPAGWSDDVRELERKVYVREVGHKLYSQNKKHLAALEAMVEGLLLQLPVELGYLSSRRRMAGQSARRLRVQPLCLTIHRGAVYFVVDALQDAAPAKRTLLTLDRMCDVAVDKTADRFNYPADFKPVDHFRSSFGVWCGDETHAVRVRIRSTYADAVRERTWHPTQRLDELSDGSVVLHMELGNLEEVSDWVLGMGEHAQVEAPDQLVEKIQARLQQALGQYTAKVPATYSVAGRR